MRSSTGATLTPAATRRPGNNIFPYVISSLNLNTQTAVCTLSLQICNGIRQSPVNIDFAGTTATGQHPDGGALSFGGYDKVRVGVFSNTVEHNTRGVKSVTDNDLKNNGHTAVSLLSL